MGYYIQENQTDRDGHRLIKKTQDLEIEIYYEAKYDTLVIFRRNKSQEY